jgi:hypothetical protein
VCPRADLDGVKKEKTVVICGESKRRMNRADGKSKGQKRRIHEKINRGR